MTAAGLSRARLGRMRPAMARHVDQGDPPGVVALVNRGDQIHVDAVGAMRIGGPAMERDTIFRIASMTKPVIAVATLILMEECALRLGDPVDHLLPELADRTVLPTLDSALDECVPARRPITVRDLLTFTAGFGIVMAPPGSLPIQLALEQQGIDQGPPNPARTPAPDEWMRRLGGVPLCHQPGDGWMYHTASDVLGVLVERAAGQELAAFLRERIFEPLGMPDTGFSVPAEKVGRFATSYAMDTSTQQLMEYDPPVDGQWNRQPAFCSGGGGLVSTVDDFLRFAQMLRRGGGLDGVRLVSRPSVETMTTDQLSDGLKADLSTRIFLGDGGWGFGVAVTTRRTEVTASVGSYGWDGGLGTSWQSDPREDLTVIVLTQSAWSSPSAPSLHRDALAVAYGAIDD
jgi:CubicO group peptidase (beta-lactamase class C family)